MSKDTYQVTVQGPSDLAASQSARDLAAALQEVREVVDVSTTRADTSTMDAGAIITIVAASHTTVAIAHSIYEWMSKDRKATIILDADHSGGKLKAALYNIDPAVAQRILEKY
ncbi:MAG TPA: hypothetical protein VGF56_09895 [Rhizomicrobium sp.]|jgi:cephalosporin hydroxylase